MAMALAENKTLPQKTAKSTSKLRIIGGKWRRHNIFFPSLASIRPTHDRIRETLFNWLTPHIVGAKCLDLFAGSGALGFEALSRGAKHCTFIDASPTVIASLTANAERLATLAHVTILQAPMPQQLAILANTCFDIIFLDPPFHTNLIEQTLISLCQQQCLHENSLIYFELEKTLALNLSDSMQLLRHQHTATLQYGLLKYK